MLAALICAPLLATSYAQDGNPLATTVDRKAPPSTGAVKDAQTPASTPSPKPTTSASEGGERDKDEAVIKKLPNLSTDYLVDLLGIYGRLGNKTMTDAVRAELTRRDPSGTMTNSAGEASGVVGDTFSPGSDPGYDPDPGSPFDAIEDQADRLLKLGKPTDAIAVLEKSKSGVKSGSAFPLELQLADAYLAAGRKAEAISTYQRVAASSGYKSTDRSEAGRQLTAIKRADDIAATHALLDRGANRTALPQAQALASSYPTDPAGQLLLARALNANGKFPEALAILETQRQRSPAGVPFEGQADYADVLYNNGRLDEAKAAYGIVAVDASELPLMRDEARRTAREIHVKMAPVIATDVEWLDEAEGNRVLTEFDAFTDVRPGTRVGAAAWHDNVSLSDERSLRTDHGSTTGGYAFIRQNIFDDQHYTDIRAGGADLGKVLYGLEVGRDAANDLRWGWSAAFHGNHPAIDSLQLIALDGRENVGALNVGGPLPLGLQLHARAGGRNVYAEDVELGDGWFAEFEIGRAIWKDKSNQRSLWMAYQGIWEEFDANQLSAADVSSFGLIDPATGPAFASDLVEDLYQPHGFSLNFDHLVTDQLTTYLGTGANYDFADDEIDWHFSAGLNYRLKEDLVLTFESGYYSDGTAANDSSEVIVGNFGLRYYY